jgi:hypothetical protein
MNFREALQYEQSDESPMEFFVAAIQDGLSAQSVSSKGGVITVTGPDKEETVGAIKTAMSQTKKRFKGFKSTFAWKHKAGDDSYTVTLTPA